jgi:hypothetical protein
MLRVILLHLRVFVTHVVCYLLIEAEDRSRATYTCVRTAVSTFVDIPLDSREA